MRTPRYKLIGWDRADKPDELYNLLAHPHETKNIAAPTEGVNSPGS